MRTPACLLRTSPRSIATALILVATLCAPAIQAVDDPVTYVIEEELPAGSLIGNIVEDSGLNLKYDDSVLRRLRYTYLTQSDNRDLFDLDERTGDLSAAVNLDRDVICPKQAVCKISLDVAVQPVEYFEAVKIFITVLDLNDNAPAFPQEAMASSLSESTVPGILFPIPTATDNDSPEFGVKRYEFVSDTDKFELQMRNTSDGTVDLHLALKGQLDHEEDNAYEMKVIAWDGGNPPRSGTITIDIAVVDINDNSPQFLNASYEANVPEDTRPDTTIIKVTALDPDTGSNGEIEYKFTPRTIRAYGNVFGIDHRTGEIYLKRALDYEETTSYNLGVTAQDMGTDSLPTPTKVIVNVLDINDHAPQITINSLTGTQNAVVPENEPAPYFVAHISVFDPDGGRNGKFNCSLDNNYFQLVQLYDTEFKVMAIAVLDREAHALHDIRIKCADMGSPPQRTTAHLMVEVQDANDNTPIFKQETYFATLNENNEIGDIVAEVQATDQDTGANGQIRYELHPEGRDYFQIDPKTGVIRANVRFDREVKPNLEFRVLASDLGDNPHTATTTVLLTIMDENDESPRFTLQRFVFNVEENVPVNTEVGQVTAADGDLPPNNQFFFGVVEEDVHGVFMLDPKNGVITTLKELNREDRDVYSMLAIVYSKNRAQRNHTARIVIYVDDENDNAPVVEFPRDDNNTVFISNLVPIGYVVTKIQAHDADYGANQKLSFQMQESTDSGAFHIGESTGEVYVNKKFDNVREEMHKLVVMVRDNGYPQRVTIAHLHIVVNETVPYRPHQGASSSNKNNSNVSDIQMIIIVCVVLGTVVLATLLVVAIIVLKRREAKQNSPKFVHKTELTYAATGAVAGADTDSCDKLPHASPLTKPKPVSEVAASHKGPDGIYVARAAHLNTVPDVAIAGAGNHHPHPEDDDMASVDGGKVSLHYSAGGGAGGGRHPAPRNPRVPNGSAGHAYSSLPRAAGRQHHHQGENNNRYPPRSPSAHYTVYMV